MRTLIPAGAVIAIAIAAVGSLGFALAQDAHGTMPMGQMGEMPMGQPGEMPMNMMNMMSMMGSMGGMQMAAPAGDEGPSSLAFAGANSKMHRDMAIAYTGNADVDFVRGMIPHHQGAIDMAKIVIAFGSDPDVRAIAEGIITAQEAEIAVLEAWLAANAP
jgi:uncharacterized protein (DUF305 family)